MKEESYLALKKLSSVKKGLIAFMLSVIAFFVAGMFDVDLLSQIMIGWNVFSICILTIDWIVFFNTPSKQIRTQARIEDSSRATIFFLILFATLASLTAVALLLLSSDENYKALHITVAVLGMALSWATVHTIFTVRYAHMYYDDHQTKKNMQAGGLDFPNEGKEDEIHDRPDFLDFAYFSFVIGMTFQVSDVQVITKKFRRFVLLHGILSFAYNTVIVALTINTLAGLNK